MAQKKPSAKARQTKSVTPQKLPRGRPPKKPVPAAAPAEGLRPIPKIVIEAPKVSPAPASENGVSHRALFFIWIGVVLIMIGSFAVHYFQHVDWSEAKEKLSALPSELFKKNAAEPEEAAPEEKKEEKVAEDAPELQASPAEVAEAEALKKQLADAEEKIQQLQSAVEEKDKALQHEITLRGQSLLAQYARLIEHALEKGMPFPWELEQLQHFADGHMPEAENLVHELAPYAQGVASMDKLREDFRTASDDIYVRWKKDDTSSGISAVFWRMMHQVISIRRVGLVEGNTPEAIVARAEYYLNKDNLPQAVKELSAFEGSYANIVEPWLAEAKLRLEALKLTDELRALAQKSMPAPDAEKKSDNHDNQDNAADLSEPAAKKKAP